MVTCRKRISPSSASASCTMSNPPLAKVPAMSTRSLRSSWLSSTSVSRRRVRRQDARPVGLGAGVPGGRGEGVAVDVDELTRRRRRPDVDEFGAGAQDGDPRSRPHQYALAADRGEQADLGRARSASRPGRRGRPARRRPRSGGRSCPPAARRGRRRAPAPGRSRRRGRRRRHRPAASRRPRPSGPGPDRSTTAWPAPGTLSPTTASSTGSSRRRAEDVLGAGGVPVQRGLVEGRERALADDLLGAEQALRVEDGQLDRVGLRAPRRGSRPGAAPRCAPWPGPRTAAGSAPAAEVVHAAATGPGGSRCYGRGDAARGDRTGRARRRHRHVHLGGVPEPPEPSARAVLTHPHHRRLAVPPARPRSLRVPRRPMVPLSGPVRPATRPLRAGRPRTPRATHGTAARDRRARGQLDDGLEVVQPVAGVVAATAEDDAVDGLATLDEGGQRVGQLDLAAATRASSRGAPRRSSARARSGR